MKIIALLWVLMLAGGIVMAQQLSTPIPQEEFWKLYPMPTSTPTHLQELREGAPPPVPPPAPKSPSEWQEAHPEFRGVQTPTPGSALPTLGAEGISTPSRSSPNATATTDMPIEEPTEATPSEKHNKSKK